MSTPEVFRDAALAVPGVLGMHAGPYGTAATFSTSGRVWGVRFGPDRLDVHVITESGRHLGDLGRKIQSAVRAVGDDYAGQVLVHIEDISVPEQNPQPDESGTSASRIDTEEPRRTS